MPAEQTTRLNKNPNLNKLQAGYLFPEVSFLLAGQRHLNAHPARNCCACQADQVVI